MVSGLYTMLRQYPDDVQPCLPTLVPDVLLLDRMHAPTPSIPVDDTPVTWIIDTGNPDAVRAAARDRVIAIDINATFSELVDAIRACHDSSGTIGLRSRTIRAGLQSNVLFSAREHDTVNLLCAGRTNPDIAAQLDISINTVKSYLKTCYRKMGVTSRDEAIRWGRNNDYPRRGPSLPRA